MMYKEIEKSERVIKKSRGRDFKYTYLMRFIDEFIDERTGHVFTISYIINFVDCIQIDRFANSIIGGRERVPISFLDIFIFFTLGLRAIGGERERGRPQALFFAG